MSVETARRHIDPGKMKLHSGFLLPLLLWSNFQMTGAFDLSGPDRHQVLMGSVANLNCSFTMDKLPLDTSFLAIHWFFMKIPILSYDNELSVSRPELSIDLQAAVMGDASLNISKVKISDEGVYKCLVIYSPQSKMKKITLTVQARPVVIITSPVIKDAEITLNCSITGFYPSDITVTWLSGAEVLDTHEMYEPQRQEDGTYNVNSTVVIIPTDDHSNKTYTCRVKHVSLQFPLEETFQVTSKERTSGQFQGGWSPQLRGLLILIPVVLLLIVVLLMCKNRVRRRETRRSHSGILRTVYTGPADTAGSDPTTCRSGTSTQDSQLYHPILVTYMAAERSGNPCNDEVSGLSESTKLQEHFQSSCPELPEFEPLRPPTPESSESAAPRPSTPESSESAAPRPSTPESSESAAPRPSTPESSESAAPRPSTPESSESATPRPSTPESSESAAPRPSTPKSSESAALRPSTPESSESAAPRPSTPESSESPPLLQHSTQVLGPLPPQAKHRDNVQQGFIQPYFSSAFDDRITEMYRWGHKFGKQTPRHPAAGGPGRRFIIQSEVFSLPHVCHIKRMSNSK